MRLRECSHDAMEISCQNSALNSSQNWSRGALKLPATGLEFLSSTKREAHFFASLPATEHTAFSAAPREQTAISTAPKYDNRNLHPRQLPQDLLRLSISYNVQISSSMLLKCHVKTVDCEINFRLGADSSTVRRTIGLTPTPASPDFSELHIHVHWTFRDPPC